MMTESKRDKILKQKLELQNSSNDKNIKIFGLDLGIEWYDIRIKSKQLLRRIAYSFIIQEIIAFIIVSYMKFVYFTSRKKYINLEKFLTPLREGRAILITPWHNTIMLTPLLMFQIKKIPNHKEFNSLASKHGDGKIVGNVMKKFGFVNISGSSNEGRSKKNRGKKNRGISIGDIKKIILNLRKGHSLAITPDGPRGPRYKINSQLINISKISGANIMPCSCYISRSITLNSWDRFIFPLPFSKICYYFDEEISIDKKISDENMKELNLLVEKKINFCGKKAKSN